MKLEVAWVLGVLIGVSLGFIYVNYRGKTTPIPTPQTTKESQSPVPVIYPHDVKG